MKWEFKLKQIERGKYSREKFMQEISDFTRQLIEPMTSKIAKKSVVELGKCFKCSQGSYLLKSYQANFYAKCSETDCKSSYRQTNKASHKEPVSHVVSHFMSQRLVVLSVLPATLGKQPNRRKQNGYKKIKTTSQRRRRTPS